MMNRPILFTIIKVPEKTDSKEVNETDQKKEEDSVNESIGDKEELKKLSKQERKAERKRVKNNDIGEKNECNGVSASNGEKQSKSKKVKKRKRQDSDEENEGIQSKKQHTGEMESGI